MAVNLSNLNRFTFSLKDSMVICSKLVIKDSTTPRMCCHTTL